ncbi:Regulatory protein cys-3 [Ophiocordyceps sinensis CO18]|uniref:Regulatory protein cys-3 n=1 Tax=Ophiocordyceps sinensis (strain Co18 / CGMCC 3.14243) TaxID=911162 RepID=T5AIT4_OPHSC|nr:Regulatory protein cys-3 [Ophiocordyceps sinensis CO18]
MSTYNGRHGANASHYLRDLNTINPQDTTTDDAFNIEDDLALFTNTQFFDFDSGQNMDFQAQPVKPDVDDVAQANSSPSGDDSAPPVMSDLPNLDFISGQLAASPSLVLSGNSCYAGPVLHLVSSIHPSLLLFSSPCEVL